MEKEFVNIIRKDEHELFDILASKFASQRIKVKPYEYILVEGEAPIMLLAHLDTVHKETVKQICVSVDGNTIMSPQGIGGDDRCGVWALLKTWEASEKKPWFLFTCQEEVGGVGASDFTKDYECGKFKEFAGLENLKALVEIDRKGSNDAVYYDCDNLAFEKYITGKGFKTSFGSFSDISVVAPALKVAAVNLSSGYYNAHTQHEYIVMSELNHTIERVKEIVKDASAEDFPVYKYIALEKYRWIYDMDNDYIYNDEDVPDGITDLDVREMYLELLYIYTKEELEEARRLWGDEYIVRCYEREYGEYYPASYPSVDSLK